jgi:hypothetical protein
MVSQSEHTHRVRSRKRTVAGKRRKRALRAKGSTPRFPVHEEQKQSGRPAK